MLSSALQKANTAVLLDNANNFEGAMEAYGDACVLLGHVMMRADVDDDRRKLMAIRDTYSRRIEELRVLSPLYKVNEKELPATPRAEDFSDVDSVEQNEGRQIVVPDGIGARPIRRDSLLPGSSVTRPRHSALTATSRHGRTIDVETNDKEEENESPKPNDFTDHHSLCSPAPASESVDDSSSVNPPYRYDSSNIGKHNSRVERVHHQHNRSISSGANLGNWSPESMMPTFAPGGHSRQGSDVSTSWLNTFDESGGSVSGASSRAGSRPGSSRSRIMQMRMAAKHENSSASAKRAQQEVIGAEIDAAVDAAWGGYGSDGESDQDPAILRHESHLDHDYSARFEQTTDNYMEIDHEHGMSDNVMTGGFNSVLSTIGSLSTNPKNTGLTRTAGEASDSHGSGEQIFISGEIFSANGYQDSIGDILDDVSHDDKADGIDKDDNNLAHLDCNKPMPSNMQNSYMDVTFEVTQMNTDELMAKIGKRTTNGILSDDDEEKMLEEMTRGYRLDDFQFDLNPAVILPHKLSGGDLSDRDVRTNDNNNNNDSLAAPAPEITFQSLKSEEAIETSFPLSTTDNDAASAMLAHRTSGVRDRRLSGRPVSAICTPLTIETSSFASKPCESNLEPLDLDLVTSSPALSDVRNDGAMFESDITNILANCNDNDKIKSAGAHSPSNPEPSLHSFGLQSSVDAMRPVDDPPTSPLARSNTSAAQSMRVPGALRQMQSAQNLRYSTLGNLNTENMSPMNMQFHASHSSTYLRSNRGVASTTPLTPGMAPLPLPTAGLPNGGYHLFDTKIHSPASPQIHNDASANIPQPLEIMPNEAFSKPFWLMRCLSQTLSHPRGAYLTSRLFVPRDIWLMKGVKIRGVEEKVAACDNLTAALIKLSVLDKSDADSLLHEMQELETVMARAETTLAKKLGSDVGASGLATMIKGEMTGIDYHGASGDAFQAKSTTSSGSGKGYLSWKKLRSKNSNSVINASYNTYTTQPKASEKYGVTTYDLPENPVGAVGENDSDPLRNKNASFVGPNAAYMIALTRLFDAAQVLDRLSIHLEGDNLHITTQVGLELVISRASEFFGLVICRFVLADVSMLLDKYVRKGTEWVVM